MPGTMGDALRAIENLPGVARAPFNSGLLIIRGGKPTDSRVFLAGAEVPQLYHFGGFTSIVPTRARSTASTTSPATSACATGARSPAPSTSSCARASATASTARRDQRVRHRRDGRGAGRQGLARARGAAQLHRRDPAGGGVPGLAFPTAPVYYDYQGVFDYPVAGGKLR